MEEGQEVPRHILTPEMIESPAWAPLASYPEGTIGSQIFPQDLVGRERALPVIEKAMAQDVLHYVYRDGHMRQRLRDESISSMSDLLNHQLGSDKLSRVLSSQDFLDGVQSRLNGDLMNYPHADLARVVMMRSYPPQLDDVIPVPNDPAKDTELRHLVDAEVLTLPDELATILILKNGLDRGSPRGLTQVAEMCGTSRVQLVQKIKQATNRLSIRKEFIANIEELLPHLNNAALPEEH